MDHHMGHGGMGHGGMGHGGGDMCSMSMLFTWDTTNLCIVFRQWHIRSTASLVVSLGAVVAIAMGHEALRALSHRFEAAQNRRIAALPRKLQAKASRSAHVTKAILYTFQNLYALMLMLVFMTYNGWVMVAVSIGAFLGFLVFGTTASATKEAPVSSTPSPS